MRIVEFIKGIFKKIAAAWTGAIETQREIITEAQEKDEKLQVRKDLVDPANYVSVTYKGVLVTMRKVELPIWMNLTRDQKRERVGRIKNHLKKGKLVYKDYGNGLKLLTDPNEVLDPNYIP